MTLQDTLVAMLIADPTLYALVVARIYARIPPKTPTLPLVVYQRISSPREHNRSGSMIYPSWQFVSWATTAAGASAVATALENALEHKSSGNLQTLFTEGRIEGDESDTGLYFVISTISALAGKEG